jgi:hypothetical protein
MVSAGSACSEERRNMKKGNHSRGALSLAACNRADGEGGRAGGNGNRGDHRQSGGSGFEAVAPGNYEIVHADGTIDQLTGPPRAHLVDGRAPTATPRAARSSRRPARTASSPKASKAIGAFAGTPPAEDGSIEVPGTAKDENRADAKPSTEAGATDAGPD